MSSRTSRRALTARSGSLIIAACCALLFVTLAVFPAILHAQSINGTTFTNVDVPCNADDPNCASSKYGWTSAGSDNWSSSTQKLTINGQGFGPCVLAYISGAWATEDQFNFTYASLAASSNFRLIAKVTGITGTSPQVGLVVRAGTAGNGSSGAVLDEGGFLYAPNAGLSPQLDADEWGLFYADDDTGNPRESGQGVGWETTAGYIWAADTTPFWIELVKVGNNFTCYKSADGVNWTIIGDTSGFAYANSTIDVGFAICNGAYDSSGNMVDNSGTASATLTNISLNSSPALPYESSWVGSTYTTYATGMTANDVQAAWNDTSGDVFTNFEGSEGSTPVLEYDAPTTHGSVTTGVKAMFAGNTAFSNGGADGVGVEGSITGDNNGHMFYAGQSGSNPVLWMASRTYPPPTGAVVNITPSGGLTTITGLAWNSTNSLLYVSQPSSNEVLAINTSGTIVKTLTGALNPGPIAVDSSGNVWVISEGNTPGQGGEGTEQPTGAPSTQYSAAVYECSSTGTTLISKISTITDTTKVYQTSPITSVSAGPLISITTEENNGLSTGTAIEVQGVEGVIGANNTTSNPTWTVTVPSNSPTTFTLNGSSGSGTYTFGGTVSIPGGMTVPWDPTSIAYDAHNKQLLITDNGPDQDVKTFSLNPFTGTQGTPVGEVGGIFSGTTPGLFTDASNDSARFFGPAGAGTDSSGNVYVSENFNREQWNSMADTLALTSGNALKWSDAAIEYDGSGDFDPYTGDFYTVNQHLGMNYGQGAGSEWSPYSFLMDPFNVAVIPSNTPTDPTGNGGTNYCTEARRINGSLFIFGCERGFAAQIDIWRLNGEQEIPCGAIYSEPASGGGYDLEIWSDYSSAGGAYNGDGIEETSEITSVYNVAGFTMDQFDVDSNGDIWIPQPSGYGANNTPYALEIVCQSVTGGVPVYASSSVNSYPMPAPFSMTWQSGSVHYVPSTNTMYVMGWLDEDSVGDWNALVERVNNFTGTQSIAWTQTLPWPSGAITGTYGTPMEFMGADGYYYFYYQSLAEQNDKVFVAEQWGQTFVYDAVTGEPVAVLQPGPDDGGGTSWDDCADGMNAFYNPATNEYDVSTNNSGGFGRLNLYRWCPFSGSPSVTAYTVTGASGSPIEITTSASNTLITGEDVTIEGVQGDTAANGTWSITRENSTQFELTMNVYTGGGSASNATYTSGGVAEYGGVPGDQDFDSPTKAGSASQVGGAYTVNGGGAGYGLSGGKDQFNLAYMKMDGNGSLSAQVTGLSGSSAAAASAGLMFRNGITAAGVDIEVSLVVTQSNGLVFQYRTTSGGATTTAATLAGITPSSGRYIMLSRSTTTIPGDTITAWYSANGADGANGAEYTELGSVVFTTPMSQTTYAGLAVTAANNSDLATGTFDRVLLTSQLPIIPAATTDVGANCLSNGVGLTWQWVPNALQYNIYRGTTSGGEGTTPYASGITSLNYTDTGAQNDVTYYYEVTAVGTGGESARSAELEIQFQNWNPDFAWPVQLNVYNFAWAPSYDAWTFSNNANSYELSGVSNYNTGVESAPLPQGGSQAGVIFDYGTISQTLSGFVSNTPYTVTFYAAQVSSNASTEPIAVTIDGTAVSLTQVGSGSVPNPFTAPYSNQYTEYTFTYTTSSDDPGTHTLAFTGTDPNGGQNIANIASISCSPGVSLDENWNPDFSWPVQLNVYDYAWAPANDAWTFSDDIDSWEVSGVSIYDTGVESAPIPQGGSQAGVIFDYGTISQTLPGFVSGTTYSVTFYAAQVSGNASTEPIEVTMDGTAVSLTQVGSGSVPNPFTAPYSNQYTEYTFTYTTGNDDPGTHTLAFTGTDPNGGQNIANIAYISICQEL